MTAENNALPIGEDPSLLLVDDDEAFLRRLGKAMEKRGFEVETAESIIAGKAIATARPPAYAVVDLRLEDGNGLDVVEVLRERRPEQALLSDRIWCDCDSCCCRKDWRDRLFVKACGCDDVTNALLAREDELPPPPENPMSADRVRWEHIQRVYELCDRNVSETARRLESMHRRTLQRISGQAQPALGRLAAANNHWRKVSTFRVFSANTPLG